MGLDAFLRVRQNARSALHAIAGNLNRMAGNVDNRAA